MGIKTAAVLLVLFFTLCEDNSMAQDFSKGDKEISLSLGYGTPWVFRDGYRTGLLPVGIAFDIAASESLGPGVLGLGAYMAATTYSEEIENIFWDDEYGRKASFIGLALRTSYHYKFADELDTYAFLHLGAGYEDWNAYGNVPPISLLDLDPGVRFMFGIGVGAKYYFSDNICALAEVGYATALFKLGVGVRL